MSKFRQKSLLLALALLLFGILLGFGGGYWYERSKADAFMSSVQSSLRPIQSTNSAYSFVHPLLAYRTPEAVTYGEYQDLKAEVVKNIDDAKHAGNVSRVSVYFRDLDTSRWVGINQNDTYYPASLLKVPVMIAYFKEAEEDPAILDMSYVYRETAQPRFDDPSKLTVGRSYTVGQLINAMAIDSDNGATLTLLAHINQEVLDSVYSALGISVPADNSADYQISTRTYGLFFRVLYNATFLTSFYSNKALALLTHSSFVEGLTTGVPDDIDVAHKFGEHVLTDAGDKNPVGIELHDCGVVYYPAHPYLLCVMTSAKDSPSAEQLIGKISKTVYEAVGREYAATTTTAI